MSGIDTFNTLSMPPSTALKTIQAGRLRGKSDINPQWRYRAMTETFGLCGIGWKYTIDRQWTESTGTGEVMAFVNVSVYVKYDGSWSDPIPGTGGSMLTANEKSGPYNSDEAFKMATTDALSVALKMVGVASAIYEGKWDGSKYSIESETEEVPNSSGVLRVDLRRFIESGKLTHEACEVIEGELAKESPDIDKLKVYWKKAKAKVEK